GKAITDWFAGGPARTLKINLDTIMSPEVLTAFQANYQVIDAQHETHMEVMSRGDQLKNALVDMPALGSTAKPTTGTGKTTGVVPGAASTASGTANVQKKR